MLADCCRFIKYALKWEIFVVLHKYLRKKNRRHNRKSKSIQIEMAKIRKAYTCLNYNVYDGKIHEKVEGKMRFDKSKPESLRTYTLVMLYMCHLKGISSMFFMCDSVYRKTLRSFEPSLGVAR